MHSFGGLDDRPHSNLDVGFLVFVSLVSLGSWVRIQECSPQIPESLQAALSSRFPGHRILNLKDIDVESGNARLYKEKFAEKFPGIAVGDFDGNRQTDYGLYLVNQSTQRCVLLAALANGDQWVIEELLGSHECEIPGGDRSQLHFPSNDNYISLIPR